MININEQMNQLGQIGSVGYSPTDEIVNVLVGRARRVRSLRQGSAAIVGSIGAIGLGLVGAQVFMSLNNSDDPALRDRNLISNDFAFLDMTFDQRYTDSYTGSDKSRQELIDAWNALHKAAAVTPPVVQPAAPPAAPPKAPPAVAPAPAPAPACVYEEYPWEGGVKYRSPETNCEWVYPDPPAIPSGWIEFGGIRGQCFNYYDVASGTTVFAAFIDAGTSWKKIVKCEGGPTDYWSGEYQYIYSGGNWNADLSGTTCTGYEGTYKGAPARYSCSPKQSDWILTDPDNWKKFDPACWYYNIATTFVFGDVTYQWTGSWTPVPPPA